MFTVLNESAGQQGSSWRAADAGVTVWMHA